VCTAFTSRLESKRDKRSSSTLVTTIPSGADSSLGNMAPAEFERRWPAEVHTKYQGVAHSKHRIFYPPTAGSRFVASDRTGRPWIYMDARSLQGTRAQTASRKRLQKYIRPSDALSASALMECAGWFLNNAASLKLVIHATFDQPRSHLSCHQRSIAKATCRSSSFQDGIRRRRLCLGCRDMTRLIGVARREKCQASRAFLLAIATAAMLW
jgi:hypothetical protein